MTVVRTGAPTVEYGGHVHEHGTGAEVGRAGRCMPATQPGYGVRRRPEPVARFAAPAAPVWAVVS
jgi:hypothetical protein